jgi:hypothetical protein
MRHIYHKSGQKTKMPAEHLAGCFMSFDGLFPLLRASA